MILEFKQPEYVTTNIIEYYFNDMNYEYVKKENRERYDEIMKGFKDTFPTDDFLIGIRKSNLEKINVDLDKCIKILGHGALGMINTFPTHVQKVVLAKAITIEQINYIEELYSEEESDEFPTDRES